MAFIKMKLTKTLYQLLYNLPSAPPEIGGLIGQSRKSDTIDTAFIDEGKFVYQDICQYTPDEILLNHIIADWNNHRIALSGIFHTHKVGNGCQYFSSSDINYIQAIMKDSSSKLYFPIIVPRIGVFPYLVEYNQTSGLSILIDKVEF